MAGSEQDRLKLCTPGNLSARANAAPLMKEICGAETGMEVGMEDPENLTQLNLLQVTSWTESMCLAEWNRK